MLRLVLKSDMSRRVYLQNRSEVKENSYWPNKLVFWYEFEFVLCQYPGFSQPNSFIIIKVINLSGNHMRDYKISHVIYRKIYYFYYDMDHRILHSPLLFLIFFYFFFVYFLDGGGVWWIQEVWNAYESKIGWIHHLRVHG